MGIREMFGEQLGDELSKRVEETKTGKEIYGGKSIFKPMSLKIWRPVAGDHCVDFIPYLAGMNDPQVLKGKVTYKLLLWVHQKVGVTNDNFVCLARNFRGNCPICEFNMELKSRPEKDINLIKATYPKYRGIYNTWVVDNNTTEREGVKIWDVATWYVEDELKTLSKKPNREGYGFIPFAAPDKVNGRSFAFTIEKDGSNVKFTGRKLVQRNYDIPDNILEQAITIDEYIYIPNYDEVKQAFEGGMGKKSIIESYVEKDREENDVPFDLDRPVENVPVTDFNSVNTSGFVAVVSSYTCPSTNAPVNGKDLDSLEACERCPSDIWGECARIKQNLRKG